MEKWAIVTGSSSGLGYATTALLLEQGWNVAGGSRSGTDIEHEKFYDMELDVVDEASVQEFYRTLSEFTDRVDLMINNAGICEMMPALETTSGDFSKHLTTNTLGTFHMMKGLYPFLATGKTHIVSIISTAARYGYPNVSAYNASKFGMLGLMESLKKEWKARQVRFTNMFPGAIDTPLWDKLQTKFSREKMMTVDEFTYVLDSVVNAPETMQFPDITFLHREGYLE